MSKYFYYIIVLLFFAACTIQRDTTNNTGSYPEPQDHNKTDDMNPEPMPRKDRQPIQHECKEIIKVPKDYVCKSSLDCYREFKDNKAIACNMCSVEIYRNSNISHWTLETRNNPQLPFNYFSLSCIKGSCYCEGDYYWTHND